MQSKQNKTNRHFFESFVILPGTSNGKQHFNFITEIASCLRFPPMAREQRVQVREPSVREWREMRRQSRSIFLWSFLSLISVITVLTLFLLGTVVAAAGDAKTKWQMYIAGNVALLCSVAPVSCLAYKLFRYKCAYSTDRFVPVRAQERETLVPYQGRSGNNECQPGPLVHVSGYRQILQGGTGCFNTPTTVVGCPPSYESTMESEEFSPTALAHSSRGTLVSLASARTVESVFNGSNDATTAEDFPST